MQVTIDIPDDVAEHLSAKDGSDLSRSVLTMLALEGYRSGELSHAQVRRMLGLRHRLELDALLKAHGVSLHYSLHDLERDRETHRRLGL